MNEHNELNLYSNNLSGGESIFEKEINSVKSKRKTPLNENEKKTLRLYKKRIIEQRNEIESLKKENKKLQAKLKELEK